jgi:RNA polymerase sigma factor (TIGR02999 family)
MGPFGDKRLRTGARRAAVAAVDEPTHEVTRILEAIQGGDPKAADELLPIVYDELRHLAAIKLSRQPPGQTLQATALVHEAYLRLVGSQAAGWESGRHFFSAAAEAMRHILVDRARHKRSIKHGGDRQRLELGVDELSVEGPSDDLVALDEALAKLAELDAEKADLVKLRYFAGLTNEQAARALGISPTTAKRRWRYARLWLLREVRGDDWRPPQQDPVKS